MDLGSQDGGEKVRGPPSKRGRMDYRSPLTPQMVEEELAKADNSIRPNHIILLTILNANYPVNVEIIHKVCAPSGNVQRIVIFERGIVQAMVEYDSIESATTAKRNLHGCDIYSGCCTLKVEFAKTDRLNVRRNDDKTFDFTVDFEREDQRANNRRVLLNEPPQDRGGMVGRGGGGGDGGTGGRRGMPGKI